MISNKLTAHNSINGISHRTSLSTTTGTFHRFSILIVCFRSGIRTKTRGRGEKILSRVRIEEARGSPLHILLLPVWSSSRNAVSCVQCPARRVLAMYWQWSVELGSWHQDCGSDNCLVLHALCTGPMAPKLKHQTMIGDQPQQRPGQGRTSQSDV